MDIKEDELFQEDTEIWIYADGIEVLKVPNFYEGVLTMYSMYYAFDVEYDQGSKPFFEYFDLMLNTPQSK